MNVQSILAHKGSEVATITQTATLDEAIAELNRRRIGALVVSGDGRVINGVLSERDIVVQLGSNGPSALRITVGAAMSTDIVTCTCGDGVDRLMELMTERRIRHLPVVDQDGWLAGIVSIGDVVKARLGELELDNRAMADYISGR